MKNDTLAINQNPKQISATTQAYAKLKNSIVVMLQDGFVRNSKMILDSLAPDFHDHSIVRRALIQLEKEGLVAKSINTSQARKYMYLYKGTDIVVKRDKERYTDLQTMLITILSDGSVMTVNQISSELLKLPAFKTKDLPTRIWIQQTLKWLAEKEKVLTRVKELYDLKFYYYLKDTSYLRDEVLLVLKETKAKAITVNVLLEELSLQVKVPHVINLREVLASLIEIGKISIYPFPITHRSQQLVDLLLVGNQYYITTLLS